MSALELSSREAFAALYDQYKGPILSYLFSIVKNRNTAEELMHETFLKAFRARESFQANAKVTTWLWTIARNTGYDHLRKEKEVLGEAADIEIEKSDSSAFETNEPSDAETQLIENSDRERVRRALEVLPFSMREAISLRVFSEMSYDEITIATGSKLSSVKSNIHRSKSLLIEELRGPENDS